MRLQQAWIPYCGGAPEPGELMGRWNADPVLLAALALIAAAHVSLATGTDRRHRIRIALAAMLALILFVSPLCALTSALFSARVVHHVLLVAVLAPLLAFGLPRRKASHQPSLWLWTAIQTLVFWAWHAPSLYAAALSDGLIYWLMQLSIIGSSTGFWLSVRASPAPASAAALLATTVQMGLLGALITFAATPLYAPHWSTTEPWGLSPMEDQQLAGLIMWAPAAGLYLGAALLLVGRWLNRDAGPAPA